MSSYGNGLLKFDPPIAVGEARRPRALNSLATPAASGKGSSKTGAPALEDILSSILPPQPADSVAGSGVRVPKPPPKVGSPTSAATIEAVKAADVQYLQFVSAAAATRLDAIHLQERLNSRLVQRQAQETGLCPVRRELYSEAFDELIRQVTVNCPERGLLLLRIRDEAKMTIDASKALFEGAHAFGVRKALVAENGFAEMKRIIKQLTKEKAELEVKILELTQRCETIDRNAQDQRVHDEKKRNDELSFYHRTNRQLASQLKTETDKANSKQQK